MCAADTEAERDAVTGVIDGVSVGVHRHAVQPRVVGAGHRNIGPKIDLAGRHRSGRLTASQDGGSPVLREKGADCCQSSARSEEIQYVLLRTVYVIRPGSLNE